MVVAGQLDLKWTGKEAMKGKKNGDDVGQKGGFQKLEMLKRKMKEYIHWGKHSERSMEVVVEGYSAKVKHFRGVTVWLLKKIRLQP